MQDSIIVYRNPLEKALWEGAMGASMVPVAAGLLTGLAVIILGHILIDKYLPWHKRKVASNVCLALGGLVGGFVAHQLWI